MEKLIQEVSKEFETFERVTSTLIQNLEQTEVVPSFMKVLDLEFQTNDSNVIEQSAIGRVLVKLDLMEKDFTRELDLEQSLHSNDPKSTS